jgi:hypothetical protein
MSKAVVRIELDDALHYSEAQRRAIIEGYPEHEREATNPRHPIAWLRPGLPCL